MKSPLWLPLRSVCALKEGDDVVNGSLEDFQLAAKIEAEDAGMFEKPILRLLGVFGMTERI